MRRPNKPRPFGLGPSSGSGIAIGIATAIAIGIAAAGGGGGPALANLWVDTNGGTCTRSSSPTAYVDAAACSSLDVAYHAASDSGGDIVYIKGGSYPNQAFTEDTGKTGPTYTTIEEAPGEQVIIGDAGDDINCIDFAADSAGIDYYLTLRGVETTYTTISTLSVPTVANNNQCTISIGASAGTSDYMTHITIDEVDTGFIFIRAHDLTITDSDLGPGVDESIMMQPNAARTVDSNNVTIDGNTIHDELRGVEHGECFALWGGDNITVSNNTFDNCEVYHIFPIGEADQVGAAAMDNISITGNTFTQTNGSIPSTSAMQIGDHGGDMDVTATGNHQVGGGRFLIIQSYDGGGDGNITVSSNTVSATIKTGDNTDCMDNVDITNGGTHIICEDNVNG